MKILMVCRLNKARSNFGVAVLHSAFPNLDAYSAGVSASANSYISEEVLDIAKKWRLLEIKKISQNIDYYAPDILSFNLIIAADCEVREQIQGRGYGQEITCLADWVLDATFCPIDPILLSRHKLEIELSKVAHSVLRGVHAKIHGSPMHQIKSFIPISQNDSELAWNLALLEHSNFGGFLIDADFRAPHLMTHAGELQIKMFDVMNYQSVNLERFEKGDILTPIREYSVPESVSLSHSWISFIYGLSRIAPVVLLTSPRFVNGEELPDSYLTSALSTSISTVGA